MARTTKAPVCANYGSTWVNPYCPACNKKNWVWLNEKSDVEAVKCWSCGVKFWIHETFREERLMNHEDDEDDSEEDLIEEAWIEDGLQTPT